MEVPQPVEIRWADGEELILDTVDGSWRYDTTTGETVRMPGRVVAFARGLVVTASCDESLECDVLVDRGNGPEVVDWLAASELFNGSIDLSPDLSGALVHVYGDEGVEFSYIDLRTGSRVDLGDLGIDPYLGVVWVEGSRWIIGQNESSPYVEVAIDTETGTQVDLELPARSIGSEAFIMAFVPSISSSSRLQEEEAWRIVLNDQGPGIHSVWMIRTFSPLREADVQDLGGRLVWEQTEIELCGIGIRSVGDGFLQIGDGFQTTEGCGTNTGMQQAFDDFGLPRTACVFVRSDGVDDEYCAPLAVD